MFLYEWVWQFLGKWLQLLFVQEWWLVLGNGRRGEWVVVFLGSHGQQFEVWGTCLQEETRAVTKLKLVVFGSLFFSMVAVVLSEFFLTAQGERSNFEVQFYDDANKILRNMGSNLQRTMEAADGFIVYCIHHFRCCSHSPNLALCCHPRLCCCGWKA
jgi:hypothetical protein